MQLRQRLKVVLGCKRIKFFEAAKPITHGSCVHAIVTSTDQVVLAVTDHQGLRWVQPFSRHQVVDQLDLVGAGAIQFDAVNHFEVLGEIKMTSNFTRIDMRF